MKNTLKTILTLFMAMVVTLAIYAVTPQTGNKVDPTGRATELADKKLQHNKQVAKVLGMDKLERKATPATQTAPVAKAQQEEMILNYDAFAGMEYYEADEEWWIGLSCDDWSRNEYGHNLNLEWKAPANNPCGTFTTEDFVYEFTHLTTPFSFGSIHFSEITMTLSHEKVSDNLERYVLTATLVGEDGNTYTVNATHEEIVPKGQVEVYIEDATLTQEGWTFAVEGKNDDLDVKLVVDNADVIGTYGKNMIIWDESHISYKGTALSPISFKAVVDLASHTETGALAYVTEITMMGNDTVDYHIILAAPLPAPTDTIELTAIDLEVDDSWAMAFGSIDFYATTPEYSIRGGWQAEFAEEGTYDAAIFLDDAQMNTITSLKAQVIVTLADDNKWAIEGTMLGSDNKIYNLHLSYTVPEQKDTVVVAFEKSAQAKYYPHLGNDIQIYNENDQYSASINVSDVELGGEFDEEYIIDFYTYLEAKDGTPITVAEIKDGKLYQVGDTTKMEADFVTFEGVLYQVRLWYVAPTPTQTVKLDIKDADMIIDYEYNQAYNLVGYTEDMQTAFVVTVYATSKDDVAGTFVNDGVFGKFGEGQYDFYATQTYVAKYLGEDEYGDPEYDVYSVEKGTMTVTMDAAGNIKATVSVICSNAVQYEISMTSTFDKPRLQYDAEYGVEKAYTAADVVTSEFDAEYGMGIWQVEAADGSDLCALYFFAEEADADIVIPAGVYPIDDSMDYGTVYASTGYDSNYGASPSLYATYLADDPDYLDELWFMVSGTVTVEKVDGKMKMTINALNSYDQEVKITYDGTTTGVENINVNVEGIRKQIVDGQLVIIRDGKAYNAQGAQVK